MAVATKPKTSNGTRRARPSERLAELEAALKAQEEEKRRLRQAL